MKVKTLICHCQGLDPSRYAARALQAFGIKSELGVAHGAVHTQFCVEEILEELQRAVEDDSDTYVMACADVEEGRKNLFKKTCSTPEYGAGNYEPLDLPHSADDGILGRIRERLEELSRAGKPHN